LQAAHLDRAEVGAYIKRHLEYAGADHDIFSDNAIDEIFKFSGGAARMVNKVCTHCCFMGRRTIGELLMITWSSWSFRESWFSSPCPTGNCWTLYPSTFGQLTPSIAGYYGLAVTMFPPTDSAKRAFDVFPTTDNVKDINPPARCMLSALH